jgi:hypothetical protein
MSSTNSIGPAQIPDHPDPFAEKLRPSIIGESTKPLTQTFGSDHGEHDYLTSFFSAHTAEIPARR